MSAGQTVRLTTKANRQRAIALISAAPEGAVVNIREATRSTEQNALMWARLSDISRAKPEGRTLTPDVWKSLFLHALDHAQRFEMALDGKGMVPVGFRSSRLGKEQFADLLTLIEEYAARHGVELSDQPRDSDASLAEDPSGAEPRSGGSAGRKASPNTPRETQHDQPNRPR